MFQIREQSIRDDAWAQLLCITQTPDSATDPPYGEQHTPPFQHVPSLNLDSLCQWCLISPSLSPRHSPPPINPSCAVPRRNYSLCYYLHNCTLIICSGCYAHKSPRLCWCYLDQCHIGSIKVMFILQALGGQSHYHSFKTLDVIKMYLWRYHHTYIHSISKYH